MLRARACQSVFRALLGSTLRRALRHARIVRRARFQLALPVFARFALRAHTTPTRLPPPSPLARHAPLARTAPASAPRPARLARNALPVLTALLELLNARGVLRERTACRLVRRLLLLALSCDTFQSLGFCKECC